SNEFNVKVCDFLATHPALLQKFLESFLCLVGKSRYYELDDNVYLVFLADDDEDEGVSIVVDEEVEATAAEKPKVQKKRIKANGASGSNHPSKKLREDHGTSSD
nr:hypothetical protein [Tanacetum cinerariifolium]